MALQSNQVLDPSITSAGIAVIWDAVNSWWDLALPGDSPVDFLYKINQDGTGEVYDTGDTAPALEASTVTITADYTPTSMNTETATLTTDSDATIEDTAGLSGIGVVASKFIDFAKVASASGNCNYGTDPKALQEKNFSEQTILKMMTTDLARMIDSLDEVDSFSDLSIAREGNRYKYIVTVELNTGEYAELSEVV